MKAFCRKISKASENNHKMIRIRKQNLQLKSIFNFSAFEIIVLATLIIVVVVVAVRENPFEAENSCTQNAMLL